MNDLRHTARVLHHAGLVAVVDFRVMYSPRTWLFGMFVRWLSQVAFWALIGRLIGDTSTVHFLLVGNAVLLSATATMLAVPSTTWERRAGTLPLLVAAPTSAVLPFVGRSIEWIPEAVVAATGTLVIAGPLFGLPLRPAEVAVIVPLLGLTALATYGLALFLGSLVVRFMHARNLVANLATGTMMVVCGVNVPLESLPGWLETGARSLPLTWGVEAVRAVVDGGGAGDLLPAVLGLTTAGAAWYLVAVHCFRRLIDGARRDGSIGLLE